MFSFAAIVDCGNHEYRSNFSEYRNKFTSPPPNVFFHSYDIGPIHLIMFNTEFYIFDQFGTDQIQTQYNWLVDDLKSANEGERRERQPWIVAVGHRPMYCSETDDTDCAPSNPIRIGYKNNSFPLEPLFYEYGVDVLIFGHEHNYERMFPIYNYTYQLFDDPNLYEDPQYPVHIISGSAGNREIHSGFRPFEPQWSFMRAKDYGFAYIKAMDKLTLDIQQYSIDQSKVIDHFVIKKSDTYPKFGNKLPEKRVD
ncbi:acid phosphatase type 7-like [Convolutriloba macropyga]|uniref:acid phosphatase type 7-like n=1 Tax=Convolutriloba macropyga TaxID=536237 RepID=UPI003F52565C